jgi:hypothetical protein
MENLARIIAVAVANNQIAPCVKVLSGAFNASTQQDASFSVNLAFTYTSGGQHVGPVYSVQPLARLTFVQVLDAYYTRARANVVDIPSRPDDGTPVVCVATLQHTSREGGQVECGPAETTTFYPTFPR